MEATIEAGTKPLKLASNFTPSEKRRTELFVRGTEPKEVSNEYAMPELASPYNVSASLDIEGQSINISWEHDAMLNPETNEPLPTTFEVSAKREGGKTISLGTTESKDLTISSKELEDGSYTISVVAVVDDTRSKPGTATFQVTGTTDEEDKDKEPETPDNPDVEEPTAPDQNGNNGDNGNHNGNGNGNNGNNSNNGNGNGNGNAGGNGNSGNTGNNGTPPGNNGNNNGSKPPTTPTEPTAPDDGTGSTE